MKIRFGVSRIETRGTKKHRVSKRGEGTVELTTQQFHSHTDDIAHKIIVSEIRRQYPGWQIMGYCLDLMATVFPVRDDQIEEESA